MKNCNFGQWPIWAFLWLAGLFVSCHMPADSDAKKRVLTVSIEPVRYLAEQIGGDLFQVNCMVPQGSSPETYEPTPRQMLDVVGSEAYLRVGPIEFEQVWLPRLRENAPHMEVVDLSEGVEFIYTTHSHGNHRHEGVSDPHIWTSPANVRLMAHNLYRALCRLAPEDSSAIFRRWQRLDSVVVETDRRIRTMLSSPEASKIFMLYHPSLGYFARDYGLCSYCLEEDGKEPSPSRLKTVTDEALHHGIKVIFIQRGFDKRSAEAVAHAVGARVVEIDPLGYDWPAVMIRIAEALKVNDNNEE